MPCGLDLQQPRLLGCDAIQHTQYHLTRDGLHTQAMQWFPIPFELALYLGLVSRPPTDLVLIKVSRNELAQRYDDLSCFSTFVGGRVGP